MKWFNVAPYCTFSYPYCTVPVLYSTVLYCTVLFRIVFTVHADRYLTKEPPRKNKDRHIIQIHHLRSLLTPIICT